jgi:hypothetical protein
VFYVFLILVGVAAVGVYLLFIFSQVPGAKEQRLGVLEPLPPDLGKWKVDEDSPEGAAAKREGLVREVRFLHYETAGFSHGRLVQQVRYKKPDTHEIVRVEPEREIKRKRVKKGAE